MEISYGEICSICHKSGGNCCIGGRPTLLSKEQIQWKEYISKYKYRDTEIPTLGSLDEDCVYMNETGFCSIQKTKPFQCRLFPFEILFEEKSGKYFLSLKMCELGKHIFSDKDTLKTEREKVKKALMELPIEDINLLTLDPGQVYSFEILEELIFKGNKLVV